MKGLSSLAAICAALLFVSVCVGLITAGPAIAQGGPNKDVRVINTAAEAIPTTITNVPAVQISGTPNVNISNVPAVQVGNSVGNPVPVNVTNMPSGPAPAQPVSFSGDMTLTAGTSGGGRPLMTVPAGKRLVISYVSFDVLHVGVDEDYMLTVGVVSGPNCVIMPEGTLEGSVYYIYAASKNVQIFVEAGSDVEIHLRRVTGDGTATTHYTVTGSLMDAS